MIPFAMAAPSVSFRISRSAEDLAATIHSLSQRLVKLEQRLAAMERQVTQTQQEDPQELASLDNVERLLQDCRDLLEDDGLLAASDGGDEPALREGGTEASQDFGAPSPRRDGYPSAA
jgi:uncharacterized membrane protein YccC